MAKYLDAAHREDLEVAKAANARSEQVRKALIASAPAEPPPDHPGVVKGKLITPDKATWYRPYYAELYDRNTTPNNPIWQSRDPGIVHVYNSQSGYGDGGWYKGTSEDWAILDWYFRLDVPSAGYYTQDVRYQFHGIYRVYADQGMFQSKHAAVWIDIFYTPSQTWGQTTFGRVEIDRVLSHDGNNIDETERFDFAYSPLRSDYFIFGGPADVYISMSLCASAQSDGSSAELDLRSGTGYVANPWILFSPTG
jgi:hypothetical protein